MKLCRFAGRLALVAILAATGCAPAYHCYDECRIPCTYCAPCPLPFQNYGGCPCHSRAAEPYLVTSSVSPELVNPLSFPDSPQVGAGE